MSLLDGIKEGEDGSKKDPRFPHAPEGWTKESALKTAQQEGLSASEDHWVAVRALQEFFAKHEEIAVNVRELHDALDEKFHDKGGIKSLYKLFPGGPVAQGCRLAGLKAPAGAVDKGFGSVM
ncbi:MAG: TusE/DsrC/DsvC family sulfur relay protein [Sulfuricaulis sp.]